MNLLPAPAQVLCDIQRTGIVRDDSGAIYPLIDALSPQHATALHNIVVKTRPKLALEVGFAYGISSLAILAGLHEVDNDGVLISIDPMQSDHYHGIGVSNVRRSGMESHHTFLEQPDFEALPKLLKNGTRIDFAYIDGWHTFDYTLLDFFFIDKMLNIGGVVGFNDCYMVAINKVIRYIQTHRNYIEVDAGLKRQYGTVWRGRAPFQRVVRRLLDIRDNDRYFRKQSDWEPSWDYYPRGPGWFLS